jgi:hypothetical protein
MSAAFQPQFEINPDERQDFSAAAWTCAYCAGTMSPASQMCLTCGMPRPQQEDRARMYIATPSPKLAAAQKPYDPYAQFYPAETQEPRVIPPVPQFEALPFGGTSFAVVTGPAEKAPGPALSVDRRAVAMVIALLTLLLAVIFCIETAWTSREMIAANFYEVRTTLHGIGASKPLPLPQYTATPISQADRAKWAAVVAPAPKPPIQIAIVEPAPAPRPSGPGTMQVRISDAPPTANMIPVSLQ